jgi:hypothetical protein
LSEATGQIRRGLLAYALAGSLLLLPILRRTPAGRPILFATGVFLVAWLQMAITKNAGGSVHHTGLLWPLPHLIVAVAIAEVSKRWRWAALVVLLVAVSNALVINQYYVQVRRNGGAGNWNESNQVLAQTMQKMHPAKVYLVDWGFFDTLRMLSRGSLRLEWALEYTDDRQVRTWLETPGAVFIVRPDGSETFQGRREQFLAAASRLGFDRSLVFEIRDRNQRPRFQVYQFTRHVTI